MGQQLPINQPKNKQRNPPNPKMLRLLTTTLTMSQAEGFKMNMFQKVSLKNLAGNIGRLFERDRPQIRPDASSFTGFWTLEGSINSKPLVPILGDHFASHVHIMQQKADMRLETHDSKGNPIMFNFQLDGQPTITDAEGSKITRTAFQDDFGIVIQEHNPFGIPVSLEERTLLDNGKRMMVSGYKWIDHRKTPIEPIYYIRSEGIDF